MSQGVLTWMAEDSAGASNKDRALWPSCTGEESPRKLGPTELCPRSTQESLEQLTHEAFCTVPAICCKVLFKRWKSMLWPGIIWQKVCALKVYSIQSTPATARSRIANSNFKKGRHWRFVRCWLFVRCSQCMKVSAALGSASTATPLSAATTASASR